MKRKHLFEMITILAFGIDVAYENSNHQETSKVNVMESALG